METYHTCVGCGEIFYDHKDKWYCSGCEKKSLEGILYEPHEPWHSNHREVLDSEGYNI